MVTGRYFACEWNKQKKLLSNIFWKKSIFYLQMRFSWFPFFHQKRDYFLLEQSNPWHWNIEDFNKILKFLNMSQTWRTFLFWANLLLLFLIDRQIFPYIVRNGVHPHTCSSRHLQPFGKLRMAHLHPLQFYNFTIFIII